MSSNPFRILVVDDDPAFREGLVTLLTKNPICGRKVEVTEARDPLDALLIIQKAKAPFDAVTSDYNMSHMNGADFIQTLRANKAFSDPVIIAVSDDMGAEDDMAHAGAQAFIPKDNVFPMLVPFIETFASRKTAARPGIDTICSPSP